MKAAMRAQLMLSEGYQAGLAGFEMGGLQNRIKECCFIGLDRCCFGLGSP